MFTFFIRVKNNLKLKLSNLEILFYLWLVKFFFLYKKLDK